jgi:hypothetical protein
MRKTVVLAAVLLLVVSTLFTIGNFGLEDQAAPATMGGDGCFTDPLGQDGAGQPTR